MIVLELPLPPSPNKWSRDGMARHFQMRAYQTDCWIAACKKVQPHRDPPEKVQYTAVFHVYRKRDEDKGLDLSWAIDALKQKHLGKAIKGGKRLPPDFSWRFAYELCGYFRDDDPAHLVCAGVRQEVVKLKDQGLTLMLSEVK